MLSARQALELLVVWVALLIYASLYPWEFRSEATTGELRAVSTLFNPRDIPLEDVLVNVAVYVPVGALAYTALGRLRLPARFGIPALFALLLSLTLEILQVYVPTRYANLYDVALNGLGAIARSVASHFGAVRKLAMLDRFTSVPAAGLGVLWLAAMFFPALPVQSWPALEQKLRLFAEPPIFRVVPLLSQMMGQVAIGWVLHDCRVRRPTRIIGVTVLLLIVQLLIATRQPTVSEVVGACVGWFAFAWTYRTNAVRAAGWACCAVVGLTCAFAAEPYPVLQNEYSWLPFTGLIELEWHDAVLLLLNAAFMHGSAIWLLHKGGLGIAQASVAVAAIAAVAGIPQLYMPDHGPDATDPLLALLLGYGLHVLSSLTGPQPRAANTRVTEAAVARH